MKKAVLTIGVAFVLGLLLTSCGVNAGTTKNARVVGGDSIKFDAAEIQAAQECVLNKFKDFEGCDLQKLWYDEEISGAMYGVDNVNGIVILSNFHVNAKGGDGSFNPNSDYSGWKWLLTRDSRTGSWDIKDWGYG